MIHSPELGTIVREARERAGMSITDMAERASVAPELVAQIEAGTLRPADMNGNLAVMGTAEYFGARRGDMVAAAATAMNRDTETLLRYSMYAPSGKGFPVAVPVKRGTDAATSESNKESSVDAGHTAG